MYSHVFRLRFRMRFSSSHITKLLLLLSLFFDVAIIDPNRGIFEKVYGNIENDMKTCEVNENMVRNRKK